MKRVQFREGGGCWGCSSWPACDYKEAATERLANPQVTLEAVSKNVFKVNVHVYHLCAPIKQTEQSVDDDMPVSAYVLSALCFQQSTALPLSALLFHASCLRTKVLVGVRHHLKDSNRTTSMLPQWHCTFRSCASDHRAKSSLCQVASGSTCQQADMCSSTCPDCRWRQQQEVKM